jgi:hypothetical protein
MDERSVFSDYCPQHNAWRNTSYEAHDGTYPWCDRATDEAATFQYDMTPCPFTEAWGPSEPELGA